MNRRHFLQNITAGALTFSCAGPLMAENEPQLPNIVLIMADDLGYKELGCYGQEKIKTPNIDRIAAEGMKFTQYYAGSAVCAPSRCNLMTGMHGGRAYIRDNFGMKKPAPKRFGGQMPLPENIPNMAKTLKQQGYATMISFMDRQVGRLMTLLKELDLDDNTVVLFTSDNGTTHLKEQVDAEFFDSVGPLRGLKGQLYEGGIRVPLVARWPGKIEAGATSDHLAAHYDLPATLADIAGTSFGNMTDGISMLPTLLGRTDKQKAHEFLFWDFAGYGGQIAVRMGEWKGIKQNLGKNPNAPLELYNLTKDIGEQHDVAAEFPDIAAEIEDIMSQERTFPEVEKFRFGSYGNGKK